MKKIISYVLPLVLGLAAVWWVFRGQNVSAIVASFGQLNYIWVCATVVACVAGHWSRAVRWRMLLAPLGYKVSALNGFWAVMVNYIANIVLPRAGEVSRCAAIYRTNGVPLATSLGTVVIDRLVDMVCFGVVLVAAVAANFDFFRLPFENAASKTNTLMVLAAAGLVGAMAVWFLYGYFIKNKEKLLQNKIIAKLYEFITKLVQGLLSIKNVRSPAWFLVHTLVIWGSYWLCMYCMMQSYTPTAVLGVDDALVLLVLGSLGFIVPVQGGIGAYHAAVSWGLMQLYSYYQAADAPMLGYQINTEQSLAFATVAHGILTLVVVVVGLVAVAAVFLFIKPLKNPENQ